MNVDHEYYLTDLIDKDILQRVQNVFSNMIGVAALTTDTNGEPVTEGSNFSEFCMKYTRTSPVGCVRCSQCDKMGTEKALKAGKSITYFCHAGLIDFAAPIMVNDKMIGCFVGGQVLAKAPDPELIRKTAEEIGVDPEEYLEAAGKIKIVDQELMDTALRFISSIAEVLSDIAYNRYIVYQAKIDMERTSNMKSDFLANMSHEIRTPMNAVIGMAEMALREDLPPAAREYIKQIKYAGKSLLTIINDILDFSKIESGKMDINAVDYEPLSLVNDVANIVMTRLEGKDVELILEIPPNLPSKLLGDNIRIKQVLLNIANNAAKFTSRGKIELKLNYVYTSSYEIELQVCVEDTGIGIKKEDLDKLFQSFQQVDSKRNRNIEGTGLGLAITKQLLSLMGGNVWVESEYGKGSRFSFVLPQRVIDDTPSLAIKEPSEILVYGLLSNPYVKEQFYRDLERLGIEYRDLDSDMEFANTQKKKKFLFLESSIFASTMEEFIKSRPEITVVLLVDFFDNVSFDIPNLLVVKKPLSILNIAVILNGEDAHFHNADAQMSEFEFIAPEANILIVDDNAVNLTVAEGLLEPLKMQIDTATSGMEAIDMISKCHYDIVFMDHMMPELDGVETTHIIRRLHPEYNDVPIIALTANAVEGTKEMFCEEGMNDFVAKPIELRILVSKVRQWLPIEKIQKIYATQSIAPKEEPINLEIGDLDVPFALRFLGNEELFWTVLKAYYRTIEKKAKLIKSLEKQENWTDYTIEVHALKSSSKQVGAISLSDKAADLEKAGNARDTDYIHSHTDSMLEQYLGYISVLEPFCQEEEEDDVIKEEMTNTDLLRYFSRMREALSNLDMDQMEEVIRDMNQYYYKEWQQEMFARLKDAVDEIDVDSCEIILKDWENRLALS